MRVIDCSVHTMPFIPCLREKGVDVMFRYYARKVQDSPGLREKILRPDEALALSNANIAIAVVYQYNANSKDAFNYEQGKSDGAFARDYAANTIKQPADSAIYFGVDYDVEHDPDHDTKHEIANNIIPHFQGLGVAMAEPRGYPSYDIGVYGSWNVCDRLAKANLVKYTWLSQSKGHGGAVNRQKYIDSKAWHLVQGMPRTDLCKGLEFDPNDVRPGLQLFGQFKVVAADAGK